MGFEVGHTFKPETSGALVWSRPFPNSTGVVLVIDTEGLGAGAQIFDRALLSVTSAISSRLIYHMMGYVYSEDVLRLHGLACMVEDCERRGILPDVVLPHITWLVNKNDLKKTRHAQTDKDVMFETSLAERANPDGSHTLAQFNATVRVVRSAFTDHVVHLVPTAAPPGVECATLTERSYADLAPGYVAVMDVVRVEIASVRPRMTGVELADMIEAILPAANEGIERVVDVTADGIGRRRVGEAKAEFARVVQEFSYPMDAPMLQMLLVVEENRVRSEFRGNGTAAAALSSLLDHYERELEEKFYGERMRAKMLNSDASDIFCAKIADEAAELFSHARLTNNGTAEMDLAAFDAAATKALAQYGRAAVGPRAQFHATQLASKVREAREAAVSETAPHRRLVWLIGSGVVFAICLVTRTYAAKFGWFPLRVTAAVLEGLCNLALVVALFAGLSLIGCDRMGPISFEMITYGITWIYRTSRNNAAVLSGSLFLAGLATFFVGNRKTATATDTAIKKKPNKR